MQTTIFKRLKEARLKLGLTQIQASHLAGLLQRDISRLENAKAQFIPTSYIQFLYSRNVNVNWLYNDNLGEESFYRDKTLQSEEDERIASFVEEPASGYSAKPNVSIPVIDELTHQGLDDVSSGLSATQFPTITLPDNLINRGTYLATRVNEIIPQAAFTIGDWVIVKNVPKEEWDHLQDGEVYLVSSFKKGIFLRRMINRLTDRESKHKYLGTLSELGQVATKVYWHEINQVWSVKYFLSGRPNKEEALHDDIDQLQDQISVLIQEIRSVKQQMNEEKED